MKFTVLGSTGFIGHKIAEHLRARGHDVETPSRDVPDLRGKRLGHVIYAIGLTGDFRQKPTETIDAHVHTLQRLMDGADFDSWLYLSSTRVYGGLPEGTTATEETLLPIRPNADTLYDLSKLLGESICLGKDSPAIRVVRLSNVYGDEQSTHNFLGNIVSDAANKENVTIGETPESSKDYVSIDDVVSVLESIALKGRVRLYNVASGQPVTHQKIADTLKACGCSVTFSGGAKTRTFPTIDVSKIKQEFGWSPRSVTDDLPSLIEQTKIQQKQRI